MTLESVPREVLVAVAAMTTLYALFVFLGRTRRRFQRQLSFSTARRGEKEARALLSARGFTVLGEQVSTSYAIEVDGQRVDVSVFADYLVERGGRRYVAEVKTGEQAPKIETRATRRQLLEYHVAFDAAGVLLVDMNAKAIREVVFPLPEKAAPLPFGWALFLAVCAAGVFVALR